MLTHFFKNRQHIVRIQKLQIFFSAFPSGIPGAGLLLLRGALAFAAFAQGEIYLFERVNPALWMRVFGLAAIIAGFSLLVGFLTPFSGFLVFLGAVFSIFAPHSAETNLNLSAAFYTILVSAAVVLLGPGAYSLDARVFGRREIIIPDHAPKSQFH